MLKRLIHGVLLANLLLIGSGAMLYLHERADHNAAHTSSNEPGDDCPICHLLLTGRAVPTLIATFVCMHTPPTFERVYMVDASHVVRRDVRTGDVRGPPESA
ncbi:hypothetical protein HED60_03005 [Planctomycetales bacterium ZRK34]|nr:hypothetical protein HED60_03005 [Planctomycetales bacterium ZRK34]